ncbi:hypothetical protein EJ08DRAFT_400519 [Tothia fuscella]|uniref:Uncharacterized protein n=1 Tax=Tothia fuscella TaxID=1048955 RepID=A0A9P4TVP6_9PEZI|nr:hypothetical protein EJ08DRAFT_400519 [Tothia fuscella]
MRKRKDNRDLQDIWNNFERQAPPLNNGWIIFMKMMDVWTQLIFKQRDKTNWLLDWVRPNTKNSLTMPEGRTSDNEMVANAIFMAWPTSSRDEVEPFECGNGIPSITLAGNQSDWKALLQKLGRMESGAFGSEPKLYARLLQPVLTRFVATFDLSHDPAIRLFWNDVVTITAQQKLCRTTDIVTGWVNGLHFWDGAGNLLPSNNTTESASQTLQLDGVTFPWRRVRDMPTAYSKMPMCIA